MIGSRSKFCGDRNLYKVEDSLKEKESKITNTKLTMKINIYLDQENKSQEKQKKPHNY